MTTTVWAFRPLPELKNQTGFVECDDALAASLIASGAAQDPQVGATALKEIEADVAPVQADASPDATVEDEDEGEYDTKVVTPKRPRPRPRPRSKR